MNIPEMTDEEFLDRMFSKSESIRTRKSTQTALTVFDQYCQYNSIEQAVGLELTEKIPDWVKNIFGWYSQDQVSEDELLNAIKYLIDEGILVVD